MAFTYEEVNPPIVENTIMQKRLRDGVAVQYMITPSEGYVLHDSNYDDTMMDEITGETITIALGYRTSTATCAISYDFVENPRGFYAVLETEVPADQIFGGVEIEPETI